MLLIIFKYENYSYMGDLPSIVPTFWYDITFGDVNSGRQCLAVTATHGWIPGLDVESGHDDAEGHQENRR